MRILWHRDGCLVLSVAWCLAVGTPVIAEEGPSQAQNKVSSETDALPGEAAPGLGEKLAAVIDPVQISNAPLKAAFEWWAKTTSVPLVVDWNAMERDGVSPETPVNLDLRNVPAGQLLSLIMRQASTEQTLIFEKTPWYLEVMTKAQANKRPVLRVYDIGDLTHSATLTTRPPRLNLADALSSEGQGGSSSESIFEDETQQPEPSPHDAGEEIASTIRDTIEPDIWTENGGQYATCRYHRGRLIVNAPLYVHAQIGMEPVEATPRRADSTPVPPSMQNPSRRDGVSAIDPAPARPSSSAR